jgi:hypothetical protein
MQPILIIQEYPIHNAQYIIGNKVKQVMLVLLDLYAPGLALLSVKLLETCGLWTSNLLARPSPPSEQLLRQQVLQAMMMHAH